MIIKRGNVDIVDVIDTKDIIVDDKKTKKTLDKAAEEKAVAQTLEDLEEGTQNRTEK